MPEFPSWTEFCSNETEHRGLDPLGLESVGASIVQRQLLPGITNATRHVRYYSFFCWAFWKFWKDKTEKARMSEQKRWRVRLENVLRAATLDRDEKIQALIGVTKAIRINGLPEKAKVSIDGGTAATAFVPANYSSSFRALGCGMLDNKRGAKLTPFGEQLAVAFDEGFGRIPASRIALKSICSDTAEVSVAAIRSVAEAISLRPVSPNEPEHRLLLELLVRMETVTDRGNAPYDIERSRTLALFLEIVDQAQGTLVSAWALDKIFATGQLPNNCAFSVPPELERSYELWRRFQERQYVKLSVYALWHEVVQLLNYAAFKTESTKNVLNSFSEALTKSSLAERWLGKGGSRLTVGAALNSLSRLLSFKPRDFGKKAIKLADVLRDLKTSTEDRVGASVVLLLLCGCYWKNNASSLPEGQLHRQGGVDRISLESIHNAHCQLANATVEEYLLWVLENYTLKQATRIAIQKLPNYRFFIVRDEDGYRLTKHQDPRSYLSYDSSRIGSAFELMADLKLINMNGSIALTATGRKVLQRLKAFHRKMNGS
jgi:hypothetical protein